MTTLSSLRTGTTTLQYKLNSEVASWNTNCKAITSCCSSIFEDIIGEDKLSSHLTYEVNIDDPYYVDFLSPNKKILNNWTMSPEALKKNMLCSWRRWMNWGYNYLQNIPIMAIDHQGKTTKSKIAEIQGKNFFLYYIDDVELNDWTTTNKCANFVTIRILTALLFLN
jgi:hypothetical protein